MIKYITILGLLTTVTCQISTPFPTRTPPTPFPTRTPPTPFPTPVTTLEPTLKPTLEPTLEPTMEPTLEPTSNECLRNNVGVFTAITVFMGFN